MMTVAQVSKRAGVSVRTLHHYDQNGLLKPTEVTEAGYRLYGQAYKRFVHIVHSVSCMILVRRFLPILGIAGLLEMVSF